MMFISDFVNLLCRYNMCNVENYVIFHFSYNYPKYAVGIQLNNVEELQAIKLVKVRELPIETFDFLQTIS